MPLPAVDGEGLLQLLSTKEPLFILATEVGGVGFSVSAPHCPFKYCGTKSDRLFFFRGGGGGSGGLLLYHPRERTLSAGDPRCTLLVRKDSLLVLDRVPFIRKTCLFIQHVRTHQLLWRTCGKHLDRVLAWVTPAGHENGRLTRVEPTFWITIARTLLFGVRENVVLRGATYSCYGILRTLILCVGRDGTQRPGGASHG